jgi:NADH-ubiquinone oxidoreductase chain 4L
MLINSYRTIIIVCSISAIIALILNKNHLLISLLSLEAFILRLVILIPVSLSISSADSLFTRIILLSIGACEASLGLALIVLISRTYGSDKIQSVTSNKC